MLTERLQIYQDTYSLAGMLADNENNIPRQLRYGEFGKVLSMVFESLDYIFLANSSFETRLVYIGKIICVMGGIRARLKLFADYKKIPVKLSSKLDKQAEIILAQARGWHEATVRRNASRYRASSQLIQSSQTQRQIQPSQT